MKKHWSFLLGASVVTGIASSFFLKKGKVKAGEQQGSSQLMDIYLGQWWFVDSKKTTQHQLRIDEPLKITIDGKELVFSLVEWNTKRLTIQDSFGFHLIVATKAGKPYTLYDEADDSTYVLEEVVSVEKLLDEE